MPEPFSLGDFQVHWLNGGMFGLDGGAMFGVVPKILWSKKYPADENNYVRLTASPLLVKTPDANIVIETGLGNKLTDKQKKIYRLQDEWNIPRDLALLGLRREDIDFVILTHFDFDHSGGVVMQEKDGGLQLTFPRAKHVIQKKEWNDVLNPNKRSAHTFLSINYETLKDTSNLELVEGSIEIIKGITVEHTGGHNNGHQIIRMISHGQAALHLGDLLPTHIHFNPLWVMAYDTYPVEVIQLKEKYEALGVQEDMWFTFYHDPFLRACRFTAEGDIKEKIPED
jgi:glyoxylase-like metal-dependent hydrolase (beta-lactamase superfamily II)